MLYDSHSHEILWGVNDMSRDVSMFLWHCNINHKKQKKLCLSGTKIKRCKIKESFTISEGLLNRNLCIEYNVFLKYADA